MQFKDVLGQEHLKAQLLHQIETGKLHHATMLAGKCGHGTLTLALALAQRIFCENPTADDSCGLCASCGKISKLQYPDLFFSFPTFESKEISNKRLDAWRKIVHQTQGYFALDDWKEFNKEKNAKIRSEECDQISRNFSLHAFEGKQKVQIIWLTELLEKEINKLLKLLEEPPKDGLFILVVEDIDAILPTVLSRCQILKTNAIEPEILKEKVQEKTGIEDEKKLESIIQLAAGDYLEALALTAGENLNYENLLVHAVRNAFWYNTNRKLDAGIGMVKWAESLAGLKKEDQIAFLKYATLYVAQVMRRKYGIETVISNADLAAGAEALIKHVEIDQLDELRKITETKQYEIERNAYAKWVFLDFALKWAWYLRRETFEANMVAERFFV